MKQSLNNNKRKAFTLIELLVVIAIIGILSGAVIVAMSGTQESATDSRIKASMDQLRSSIEIYGLLNGSYYGSD
jgi:general secretion pathway protein G